MIRPALNVASIKLSFLYKYEEKNTRILTKTNTLMITESRMMITESARQEMSFVRVLAM